MAWRHQAKRHYLSQCLTRYLSPNNVTRRQWMNLIILNPKITPESTKIKSIINKRCTKMAHSPLLEPFIYQKICFYMFTLFLFTYVISSLWILVTSWWANIDWVVDKLRIWDAMNLIWRDCNVYITCMEIMPLHPFSLQWRHNGNNGVSNHQPHQCLLNRLFRHRSKNIVKVPLHWPLCGKFTSDCWFSRTNGL